MFSGLKLLQAKIPNPGSSLLNPRSQRAKLRKAMATHAQQQEHFEAQAAFAQLGGTGDGEEGGTSKKAPRRRPRAASKAQRKSHHTLLSGSSVAENAKYMTDSEWESVSMDDKHAFTKYMSKLLKEHPTEATEQQRRRYFETTMMDPRDLDPNRTVRDEYERIKLGLPVQLKNPQRSLGVSQAMYEAGDSSLFEPENAHRLENAMTQIKQVFADYMRKKREGTATEAERRKLANLTADLNVETQKHLANMFKYAQARIHRVAMEERQAQLSELERLKEAVSKPQSDGQKKKRKELSVQQRKAQLTKSISKAVGLDIQVVNSLLAELDAQERFMQLCEVVARLTVGRGFEHTSEDEGLDAYTESIKKLYSVDAGKLSTLDAVQYMAAKDNAHPVEWAKRWYERALLVPLQNTPEYKRLEEMRLSDMRAMEAGQASTPQSSETGSSTLASSDSCVTAVSATENNVVNLVEKMFLKPDDPRLEGLHEKRLRYLAYLQMERQIAQARDNAKRFEGVEHSTEADECRELYRQLLGRKAQLSQDHGEGDPSPDVNVFADAEAAALFEKIRDIAERVIHSHTVGAGVPRTKASERAGQVSALLQKVLGGNQQAGDLQQLLSAKKRATSERLLGIMENDVRSEMTWLENMEEAERPPLLPVPETGMSYVSAAEVNAWKELREENQKSAANPFKQKRDSAKRFQPSLLGQTWSIPDKPMLFWGTGTKAVQQALQHAAEDASRRSRGEPLAPPYPCAENPWGWRLVKDPLDD